MTTDATTQIETDKLMAFVFRAVDEVGATLSCALVHMGDRLGYYRDLAAHGPTTPEELAARTETGLPSMETGTPLSNPTMTSSGLLQLIVGSSV